MHTGVGGPPCLDMCFVGGFVGQEESVSEACCYQSVALELR